MKAIIIGNGPSLSPALLRSLDAPTWAVNRVWKMFQHTSWRPDNWVRGELPAYEEEKVIEDFKQMRTVGCKLWIHRGFTGLSNWIAGSDWTAFTTCDGTEAHDWHLPEICGYGTVVHIAIQLAITNGATEIELVGCDLGMPAHFYGQEGNDSGDELALNAHKIAARCSPVPVKIRTMLTDVYERN